MQDRRKKKTLQALYATRLGLAAAQDTDTSPVKCRQSTGGEWEPDFRGQFRGLRVGRSPRSRLREWTGHRFANWTSVTVTLAKRRLPRSSTQNALGLAFSSPSLPRRAEEGTPMTYR